jgi:hypothetical protein
MLNGFDAMNSHRAIISKVEGNEMPPSVAVQCNCPSEMLEYFLFR